MAFPSAVLLQLREAALHASWESGWQAALQGTWVGLGEAQGWRVPEVLCPVQVAQALLRFCRLSALARGCWGRSCQHTSSWMLSACSWSGTTSTSPAQCKVLTHPPATPFRLSARMAQAVRPFCAGGGRKEDTGPSAAVVSPLLDEHRSLIYFCFKCALG